MLKAHGSVTHEGGCSPQIFEKDLSVILPIFVAAGSQNR
jgi:hypothetical protein